jgi:hypothetical protein
MLGSTLPSRFVFSFPGDISKFSYGSDTHTTINSWTPFLSGTIRLAGIAPSSLLFMRPKYA